MCVGTGDFAMLARAVRSFNAARGIMCVGTRILSRMEKFFQVSMPHAALCVSGLDNALAVQFQLHLVSMPHAALCVSGPPTEH